jgi:hypothetical protein
MKLSPIAKGRCLPPPAPLTRQRKEVRLGPPYFPDADRTSSFTVTGYAVTATVVQVLRQCGDDLTRENVMRQAANLKGVSIPMLLPGISINTGRRLFPNQANADGAVHR